MFSSYQKDGKMSLRELEGESKLGTSTGRWAPTLSPIMSENTRTPKTSGESMLRLGDLETPNTRSTGQFGTKPILGTRSNFAKHTPGGYHVAMNPELAEEDEDQEAYLPSYILGVTSAPSKETYAAPMEPETSWALRLEDLSSAPNMGKFAPFNVYNTDDDTPPQESLLDLANSAAVPSSVATSSQSIMLNQVNGKLQVRSIVC
jgi:hypothetical protein